MAMFTGVFVQERKKEVISELKTKKFKKEIIGKLKKVFDVEETSTGDVHYKIKEKATGKFVLRTKHSQSSRIGPWQLEQIKKQLKMRRKEFENFRDCPLRAQDYRRLLVERGIYVPSN